MNVNPMPKLMPKYAAAAAQVVTHGSEGTAFARKAWEAPDDATRFDLAIRSYNSFDHAATASEQLPLDRFVPGLSDYRAGYAAAKTAVTLLVASGAVPGARERVGADELLAAREELHRGVALAPTSAGKYDRYRALDFLGGSLEDATTSLLMLRKPTVALPLLKGLRDVRTTVARRQHVSDDTHKRLDGLFDQAGSEFAGLIGEAQQEPVASSPESAELVAEARNLLAAAGDVKTQSQGAVGT